MTSPDDTTLREQPERAPRARRRLVTICLASQPVMDGPSIELGPGIVELGRAVGPSALGLSRDPRISRRHATLEIDGTGNAELVAISPTDVDGVSIHRAPLHDGSVILLGESALVFRDAAGAAEAPAMEGIVGESPRIRAVRRSIARVAPAPVTVLILGESGTGKELVARALHERSGRSGPFVAVNCAAIPATLAESQLFGHTAGAFTGAQRASDGVFRAAHGGTIFLDELGDLPLDLQPKLLRVLEERTVVSVGSSTPTPIDVRVVTATHRDLIDAIQVGRFRGDLYARLAEFTLSLPSLRERREDILSMLAHHFGAPLPPLGFDLIRALLVHPYPFNVRELRTLAAQLRLTAEEERGPLGLAAVADRLESTARLAGGRVEEAVGERDVESKRPPAPPDREELAVLLRRHRGNVTEIAKESGRSRRQVYRWLETCGLDPERFRE